MNEVSITAEGAVRRRILLSDGRIMLFYTFEQLPSDRAPEASDSRRNSGQPPPTRSGGRPVV